jgi:electron transfer flavoprotein beta subunit
VETDEELQPIAVARLFKKLVEKEQPQVVVLGKQAIDDDSNQTGQMLAGMMDWSQVRAGWLAGCVVWCGVLQRVTAHARATAIAPQGTHAYRLKFEPEQVECIRETDTGLQTLKLKLPSVITCDLRLNEPIFAKLPEIMKAKSKPLQKYGHQQRIRQRGQVYSALTLWMWWWWWWDIGSRRRSWASRPPRP